MENADLLDHAKIRILLIPVPPISKTKFEMYSKILAQITAIRLDEIAAFLEGVGATSFLKWNANPNGRIMFNFVKSYSPDHLLWEEFQISRRVCGVIGIMDCTNNPSLGDGFKKFSSILTKYKGILAKRCFAFEPAENQPDDEGSIIMIPNQGMEQIRFYLTTQMNDFCAEILKEFGKLAESIEKRQIIVSPPQFQLQAQPQTPSQLLPPGSSSSRDSSSERGSIGSSSFSAAATPSPSTTSFISSVIPPSPLSNLSQKDAMLNYSAVPSSVNNTGAYEGTYQTTEDIAKLKKKCPLRVQKLLGDICLISGLISESVNFYNSAIEQAKVNQDSLWQGGALEGLIAASYLLQVQKRIADAEDITPDLRTLEFDQVISDRYRELIALYTRGLSPLLSMETHLRFGRYLGVHGRRAEASDIITSAAMLIKDLSITEKIEASGAMATLFRYIGLKRKYSFFLRRTAQLLQRHGYLALALELRKQLIDSYDFEDAKGWPSILKMVMKETLDLAEAVGDTEQMISYTVEFLQKMRKNLSDDEQRVLMGSLLKVVEGQVVSVPKLESEICIPFLRRLELVRPPTHLVPSARTQVPESTPEIMVTKDAADPFIYNPFGKKKSTDDKIVLVKNESCYIIVELENPMAFELTIDSISLSTSGAEFEAFETSVTLNARTQKKEIMLVGRPLQTGQLRIRGCRIRAFGVDIEHLVDLQGIGFDVKASNEVTSMNVQDSQLITVNVIEELPLMQVKENSLLNAALMLLEGEKSQMTLHLENVGSRPINHINVTFEDIPVNYTPEEFDEEYHYSGFSVFGWDEHAFLSKLPLSPENRKEAELVINVFGKRGCTGGVVKIEYGFIDPDTSNNGEYHTRKIEFPVLMTVFSGLECSNADVLLYRGAHLWQSISDPNETTRSTEDFLVTGSAFASPMAGSVPGFFMPANGTRSRTTSFGGREIPLGSEKDRLRPNQFCLLTFDVRNLWNTAVEVVFVVNNAENPSTEDPNQEIEITTIVQPRNTKRVVMPVRRIELSDADSTRRLPDIENKQYVVAKGPKKTAEEENQRRRLFWFKDALMKRVTVRWTTTSRRYGHFCLLGLNLTRSMLQVLRTEDISFSVTLSYEAEAGDSKALQIITDKKIIQQRMTLFDEEKYSCTVGKFVNMNFHVCNNRDVAVKLLIRILPVQDSDSGFRTTELAGKVLVGGQLESPLPVLKPKESAIYTLPVCFLSRGNFKFLYHAEDADSKTLHWSLEPVVVAVIPDDEK